MRTIMKILCPHCGVDYDPLMTLDGQVFCPSCDNIQLLQPNLAMISHSYKQEQDFLQELDMQLRQLAYPGELFLTALIGQDNIAEDLLKYPTSSPPLVERWWYYEFLLERMSLLHLNLTSLNSHKKFIPSKETFEYLQPYVESGIQAYRWIQDFQNGKVAIGSLPRNPQINTLYFTNQKWLWSTPKKIALDLFRQNPDDYPYLQLDFRGLIASVLTPQDPHLQKLNAGARIWTNLFQFSSAANFFEDLSPEDEERLLKGLHFIDKTCSERDFEEEQEDELEEKGESFIHFLSPGVVEVPRIIFEVFHPLLTMLYEWPELLENLEDPAKLTPPAESNEILKQLLIFFSQPGSFRSFFHVVGKSVLFSIHNVKLFHLLLENYSLIQKPELRAQRKEVSAYRSRKRHEPSCWHLGAHLNVQTLFPDGTPMFTLDKIPGKKGHIEIDVLYHYGTTLSIIECKSDIAITPRMQEGYYQKLIDKVPFIRKFCEGQGLSISEIRPQILGYICGKKPRPEIDFFITEMQFLEYYASKVGLFRWTGDRCFDQYPLVARIGWTNIALLKERPVKIDKILDGALYLIGGHYQAGTILFKLPSSGELITHPIEPLGGDLNWNQLEVLLIWDDANHLVRDYLFLPPYVLEPFSTDDWVLDAWEFHTSKEGQRFLYVAVLNGAFGFCDHCKIVPLIPRGGKVGRPGRGITKVFCFKCNAERDLPSFDAITFGPRIGIEENVQQAIRAKFPTT